MMVDRLEAAIVGMAAYPLHEWLSRRRTIRELRTLRTIAALPAEAVRADAARRLEALLHFGNRALPFYAERFRAAKIDLSAGGEAGLHQIPPLSKAEVRGAGERIIWRRVPGGALPHRSGGTTGDTLHFMIDRIRQAQTLAARLFMQEQVGVALGRRRVYFWGSPIEQRGAGLRRIRDRLLNEALLNAFDLAPEALDRHLDRIAAFRPALLYAYPSAAAALARRAIETRRARRLKSLTAIVLTGEEVTDAQRFTIRAARDCTIVQEYGSREVGLIAHECRQGGLHVLTPHVLVEAVAGGAAVAAGQTGELLCTTLNTRAQPFIRYRVGDAGALLDECCRCGLPFPLMRLDGGKITGFLALPGGRLCHGAITSHVLRDQPGIVQFKTIQRALERFELMLVTDARFRRASLDTIQRRYHELFGTGVILKCAVVDQIPPDPSGKRRYFVSEAREALQAVDFMASQ